MNAAIGYPYPKRLYAILMPSNHRNTIWGINRPVELYRQPVQKELPLFSE